MLHFPKFRKCNRNNRGRLIQSSKLRKLDETTGDFIRGELPQEANYRNDAMLFKTKQSNVKHLFKTK